MGIYNFQREDAERFARERGGKIKTTRSELKMELCPYCHGGSKPDRYTFAISLMNGAFNCARATCGAKGSFLSLAREFSFSLGRDVDEYYNSNRGFRQLRDYPLPKSTDPAVRYMESRCISKAVTERYNITTRNDDDSIIAFPFCDDKGDLTFIKYRNTNPKPGQDKEWCQRNCKPILFGMNHCNPSNKTLVLTEGQIDSLSCTEAGIENAVSVPTGAKGFTWVPYCWDFLGKFDTLIVFGDHEGGKITLLDEMRQRFHGTVKHVRPEDYKGCKDANELLKTYGKQAVADAVNNAEPVRSLRIKELADVENKKDEDVERIPTGIGSLDRMSKGLRLGDLVILSGERGNGKSTLASQFGLQALDAGYSVMFYSGELRDTQFKQWIDRQAAGAENIETSDSNLGYKSYAVKDNVRADIERWYRGRAYLYDNQIVGETDENETVLDTLKKSIVQYQCRVLVIDNLMTALTDDLAFDKYRQQSNFVGELINIAKAYNVLIILVAHPRKRGLTNGVDNDDISGSADITNRADMTLYYTQPGKDAPVCNRVLKVLKNRDNGKLDYDGIPLWFEESSKRITSIEGYFTWRYGWNQQTDDFEDWDDEIPF